MAHVEGQRRRQMSRVLLLVELLAPLRHGATVEQLTRDVSEIDGAVTSRTVRRDLHALEAMALADRVGKDRKERWFLAKDSPTAARLHEVAERHAELSFA